MGLKEQTLRSVGFTRLAIFRPGIIVGNAHTPVWVGWMGRLVPGPFGNIDQRILGRSIAAEIALHSGEAMKLVLEAEEASDLFFDRLERSLDFKRGKELRLREPGIAENSLDLPLAQLYRHLADTARAEQRDIEH